MQRMAFRDHQPACGDRRGEISARYAVERERKVIWAHCEYRPNGREVRTYVGFTVDDHALPGALARRSPSLTKLGSCARQLDIFEPWADRQRGLRVRARDQC